MTLTGLASLLLVASPLVVACGSGDGCEDLDSLKEQRADTPPEDPEFNDLTEKIQRAEADCNAQ
jgi:hypothetical protein